MAYGIGDKMVNVGETTGFTRFKLGITLKAAARTGVKVEGTNAAAVTMLWLFKAPERMARSLEVVEFPDPEEFPISTADKDLKSW